MGNVWVYKEIRVQKMVALNLLMKVLRLVRRRKRRIISARFA